MGSSINKKGLTLFPCNTCVGSSPTRDGKVLLFLVVLNIAKLLVQFLEVKSQILAMYKVPKKRQIHVYCSTLRMQVRTFQNIVIWSPDTNVAIFCIHYVQQPNVVLWVLKLVSKIERDIFQSINLLKTLV